MKNDLLKVTRKLHQDVVDAQNSFLKSWSTKHIKLDDRLNYWDSHIGDAFKKILSEVRWLEEWIKST